MPEVLSQEDIDTLLTVISTGESDVYSVLEPNTEVFVFIRDYRNVIFKGKIKSLLQSSEFLCECDFIYDIEYHNKDFNESENWSKEFYYKIHNVKRTDIFKSFEDALEHKIEVLEKLKEKYFNDYCGISQSIESTRNLLYNNKTRCPNCFSSNITNNICSNCGIDFKIDIQVDNNSVDKIIENMKK